MVSFIAPRESYSDAYHPRCLRVCNPFPISSASSSFASQRDLPNALTPHYNQDDIDLEVELASEDMLVPWPYDTKGIYEHHPDVPRRRRYQPIKAIAKERGLANKIKQKAKTLAKIFKGRKDVTIKNSIRRMPNSEIPHPPWGSFAYRSVGTYSYVVQDALEADCFII